MRHSKLTRYLIYQLYHARLILAGLMREGKNEEIHEFRVALRRVRSLVKLYLKDSISFPDELKSAVKKTNPIRELDVLIESIDPSDFPKTSKMLRQTRRERFHRLFTDSFITNTLQALSRFDHTLCDANPDIADEHFIRTLEEYFKSAVDAYRSLNEETGQKEFHSLRVDFKNIRYGFEFLNAEAVLNKPDTKRECKKFQNTLGAVQDAYNQVHWLKKLYKQNPRDETLRLLKERKKRLKKLKAASRSSLSRVH